MLAIIFLLLSSSGILLYLLLPYNHCVSFKALVNKSRIFLTSKIKRAMQTRSAASKEPIPFKMQEDSLLFNLVPGEIRDRIFQYAVTEHAIRKEEFQKNTHYYRPGFRFADQEIDTALLRTCRRIYQETRHLPSRNHVQVEWCFRAPPNTRSRFSVFDTNSPNMKDLRSLHLFTQQFWLESWGNQSTRTIAKKMPNLQYLKITLRHGDWWSWEDSAPLKLDPKQSGTADMNRQSQQADPFHPMSWGYQLQKFPNLKMYELELESIEGKRTELDEIVRKAPGWQFPMIGNQALVWNPRETKRTGRIGLKLRKFYFAISLSLTRLFYILSFAFGRTSDVNID